MGRTALLLHRVFEASLLLKGAFALGELLAGIAIHLVPNETVLSAARRLTLHELTEDPSDRLANALLHWAQQLSLGTQSFYALYLASHGIVKLVLVAGLALRWRRAYPAAMVTLALFIAYQLHRWMQHRDPALLFLSAFDAVVIYLTWIEYRRLETPA